jgi:hypothetical protein
MAAPFAGGAVEVVVVVGAIAGVVAAPTLPPYVTGATLWEEAVCVTALTGWVEDVVVVLVVLVDVENGKSPVACRVPAAAASGLRLSWPRE